VLRDHDPVMLDLEAAGERLAQLRDLRAHSGCRELGEHGACNPERSASSISRTGSTPAGRARSAPA
jgi:hypothetical protein